jgi:hypothetical protein
MTDHSLTLGALLLTESQPDADHYFTFTVLADNLGFGVAQGVREVVTSLLSDGDLVRTTRYGNREVSFAVMIEGPSLGSLAHGEAALRAEIGRGNTLTWQAPDVLSVPTAFEVIDSEMSQTFDDLDELRRRRVFVVTLTCAPFARSAEMSTVAAMDSGTTTVVVDTCDATTDWTGTRGGVAEAVSGFYEAGAVAVAEVSNVDGFPPENWTLTRTGSIDLTSTPLLVVEMTTLSAKGGAPLEIECYAASSASGSPLPILAVRKLTDGSGHFQVTFDGTGLGVIAAVTFAHTSAPGYGHTWQGILVRNVSRADVPPSITTRQLTRIIDVGGTERTPCSLKVVPGAAEALGLAIVHTSPESGRGYSPSLRQWRVSGNPETSETGSLSGLKEAVTGTPIVAQMPIVSLPEDGYALMAYMRSSAVGTFPLTWQARTTVDSIYYGGHEGVTNAYFPVAGEWTLIPLAVVTLPPVRAAVGGEVQFNLTRTVVDEEIYLDEWWPFRMGDDCALTIVKSDEASFLWLDSPDASSPVPRVWVSNNSDRSDQRHPGAGVIAQGNHVLTPDGTMVFVASTGIELPALSATYYKRWHSNAAE